MHGYLAIGLWLLLNLPTAEAGDPKTNVPTSEQLTHASTYHHLTPELRAQKAKEAVDATIDDKTRFETVRGLAISGYTPESANALSIVASNRQYQILTREYAAMGLRNFTSCIPQEVRKTIQDRLLKSLEDEKCELPDGILRTLITWGQADQICKVLGNSLRGHRMEVPVLEGISSQDDAVTRLWDLCQAAPPATEEAGWIRRFHIGNALVHQKDKRGIDILLECLTVKEPWPIDNPSSPQAKELSDSSFRQSLHNTFGRLARIFDEDFGYGGSGGTWRPQLVEAIPKMVNWWKANRDTWSFEEAASLVVPTIEPGKPLTKRQARVWAANLANLAFAKKTFKRAHRQPVGKIKIRPEDFHVAVINERWELKIIASSGPEAFVSFALDGTDTKVFVNYALT